MAVLSQARMSPTVQQMDEGQTRVIPLFKRKSMNLFILALFRTPKWINACHLNMCAIWMQQLSGEHFQAGEMYLPTAVYFSSKSLLSFWNSCSGKLKEIGIYVTESYWSPNIPFYPQTITLKISFTTSKKVARAWTDSPFCIQLPR